MPSLISNISEIRTLLVDDELANLRLLIEFLQNQGHILTVAQNGTEGLRIAADIHPELILLDVRMPDMDGFTFYRQLSTNPNLANTLVIFISAIDDIDYKEYALGLGGVDYITKPIDSRELVIRIRAHLGRQHQYLKALARLADYEQCIGFDNTILNKQYNFNTNAEKIRIISEYLLRNLRSTPSLNELASIANTNRTTINIQFRSLFGMSIFEWLVEQRLLQAAILLRTSSMRIHSIADTVGYASKSALTNAFKRRFGCTPGEYRVLDT